MEAFQAFGEDGSSLPDFTFGQSDWIAMARVERKRQYVAVYDGSGSIGQGCAYAYGGAVSSQPQWNAFAEFWKIHLDKNGLAYFKMSEAMTARGEFESKVTEWGSDFIARRDALVNELAGLKRRYALAITGSGIATRDGSALKPSGKTTAAKTEVFKDAVGQLLSTLPVDSMVHFICDIELDAEESYRGWIQSMASQDSPTAVKIIGTAFFDDAYSIPLQFADMVAWFARQELERVSRGRPDSEKDPIYDLIMEGNSGGIVFID